MVPQAVMAPWEPPVKALCCLCPCPTPFRAVVTPLPLSFFFHISTSQTFPPTLSSYCLVLSISQAIKSCRLPVSFVQVFLPSQLIYGGWNVALVLSYDVWPQRLFLSALIWQCYCCHGQAVTPFSYFFFTSPHLKAQEYLAQS